MEINLIITNLQNCKELKDHFKSILGCKIQNTPKLQNERILSDGTANMNSFPIKLEKYRVSFLPTSKKKGCLEQINTIHETLEGFFNLLKGIDFYHLFFLNDKLPISNDPSPYENKSRSTILNEKLTSVVNSSY